VDLQFEICQRCHLQDNAVLNEGKSFYDFKPGMRLSEVMNVFMPVYKGRENEHIMASHVERLRMSQCFIQTMKRVEDGSIKVTDKLKPYKDALTCVTCHNPHVSVTVTGKEIFNNACRKCHDGIAQQVCNRPELKDKHTVDGNCVNCHMPKSNTIDIPHVISTDHYIRKPLPVAEINKVKTYLGIKCINNPKPEAGTTARAYIQYYERFDSQLSALDSAKRYLPDNTPEAIKHNFKNLVYLSYVKKDYATVVKYAERLGFKAITDGQTESWSNDDAWTDYRIGHAYYNLGKYKEAKQYLQLSSVLASSNLEFKNQLGATYIALGENQQAMQVYATIIHENPNTVAALNNYGYTLLLVNNDVERADEYYNKALALDPDYEQAMLNKAGLKIYKHQYKEAQQLLQRIIKKNSNNVQAKDLLLKLSSL
jgi:tetratricopeptide (TPR) repeat protein